jgi:hypothetical protein
MHRELVKALGMYDLIDGLPNKKIIGHYLAYNVVGIGYTKMLYESLKPIMRGMRREINEPRAYCGFDYLIGELTRKERQLRKTTAHILGSSEVS